MLLRLSVDDQSIIPFHVAKMLDGKADNIDEMPMYPSKGVGELSSGNDRIGFNSLILIGDKHKV